MIPMPEQIHEYAAAHSSREDALLAELWRDTQANAKRPIAMDSAL